MKRYADVDIFAELSKLVDRHVEHYKDDFVIDRDIISRAAASEHPDDKALFWFCRQNGTNCLRESQAFIRDTREHTTLLYYAEQSQENITARFVVPKQIRDNTIFGDIFEVGFREQAQKVAKESVQPLANRITFNDGYEAELPFKRSFHQAAALVPEHGQVVAVHAVPEDASALVDILSQQKRQRNSLPLAHSSDMPKKNQDSTKERSSIRDRLKAAQKEPPTRSAAPSKSKGKEMVL